ncbi:MAG: DUF2974 domain-containing protein [Lachnospiraceae bacterium]|nr:DUF2974 domain-containing protein [Lachnospiraceae bacterium]MBQ8847068.1 DUF2974 domain-containing protein [Lachnospiraceae bacterium]
MASLSDYLVWRGDITFDEVPLNVVDALLLSQMSYLNLQGIIGKTERKKECTLAQAAKRFWQLHTEEEFEDCLSFAVRSAGRLLRDMAKTKRFRDLVLRNYVNRNDLNLEEQFAALEIVLNRKESYISFGGTDDTLIGWKEDFNMCFLSPIPAQMDAKSYLESVLLGSGRKVYIGGHSKGGNLAVYSAVKCKKLFRRSILHVYNFDGPGFNKEFIESERYQDMKERIETWVPESSVVGMLLEHEEDYQVVKSSQNGFMQHDATSWEVLGAGFIELPAVKQSSRRLAAGVKEWMNGLSPEELSQFGERIYEVLTATDAKTLADLNKDRWKSITSIIQSFNAMDKKTKEMLFDLIKAMVGANVKKESLKTTEPAGGKAFGSEGTVRLIGRKKIPGNSH